MESLNGIALRVVKILMVRKYIIHIKIGLPEDAFKKENVKFFVHYYLLV